MTPEQIRMRDAIASTLYVNGYVSAPTPSRRAADAVMRVLSPFIARRAQTPERCDSRFLADGGREYVCHLAAGHRAEFHLDTQALATWSRAGDLQVHSSLAAAALDGRGPVSLQHDACGALLAFQLHNCQPVTLRCALGPHDAADEHRAADGTQWQATAPAMPADRVYLSPAKMALVTELEQLAAPSEAGALNLGPIIERQRLSADVVTPQQLRAVQGDVMDLVREVLRLRRPKPAMPGDAVLRSALPGISEQIDSMVRVFAELREAVDSGQLNAVRAVLKDAGLGYAPPADDAADLVRQRDGALEHVTELREAVRAEIVATVHQGHSVDLDDCTHHACVNLREAARR